MKYKNHIKTGLVFSVLFLLFLCNQIVLAQENEAANYRSLFYLNATKFEDGTRELKVEFLARHKKNRKDKIAVTAAPILYYNVSDGEEILLGQVNTDKKGIAILKLNADQELITDEEGYITFLARFEGTDAMDEEEEELMIRDLHLELNLELVDSVKTAYINAYTLDSLGEQVPVEEMDFILGVESMLSMMPLTEDYLEEGEYEFELPDDIPGNEKGELVVQVLVDESDEFGSVIQKQTVNWGTRKETAVEERNELWTDAAPVWMYVVLTIMLVGVWANYVYTVINLRRIKKMGSS